MQSGPAWMCMKVRSLMPPERLIYTPPDRELKGRRMGAEERESEAERLRAAFEELASIPDIIEAYYRLDQLREELKKKSPLFIIPRKSITSNSSC